MSAQNDISTWSKDISTNRKFPSVSEDFSAEIVIIGAGITGITAAYLFRKAGKEVVLIEKNSIASGTTSYSTGFLVNATEVLFHELLKSHDFDSIKTLWDEEMSSINLIQKIVQKEKLDCEFSRLDLIYYAKTDEDLDSLKKEFETLQKAKQECEFSTCENCIEVKAKGFLKLKNQGKFNPAKYVIELGKVIEKLGVKIYENSNVEDIKQESDHASIFVNQKEIKAQNVILATHSPIASINLLNSTKIIANLTYVIEAKIPKNSLKEFLYEDLEKPYHYLRIDSLPNENFDRLIFGGEDNKVGEKVDSQVKYKNLENELKNILPNINFEITKNWSGEFYDSADDFPLIGKVSENIIVCTGFSGSGLPTGTLAANFAKDLILKNVNKLEKILNPKRIIMSKNIMEQGIATMKNYAKKVFDKPAEKSLDQIPADSGEVITINGRQIAVSKDKDGNITQVSPICTHLGCTIQWDKNDKCWDCPCHGSRFRANGEVIEGPATKPLEKI